MDKLKSSIEEANHAVDKEREKNVSLLHLIFPPDIAKRLWLGKLICSHFFLCLRIMLTQVLLIETVSTDEDFYNELFIPWDQ